MKNITPPLKLALTVALSIFAIEMVIMRLIPSLHLESPWVETLLDAGTLVLALVPILLRFHPRADAVGESDVVDNGAEALRALESTPYALILMDSHMPEMDGFAATAAIRGKGGKFKDIPIIAVTADALTGDREKCIQAGMSDYLSKPLSLEAVRRMLSHWLHDDTDA